MPTLKKLLASASQTDLPMDDLDRLITAKNLMRAQEDLSRTDKALRGLSLATACVSLGVSMSRVVKEFRTSNGETMYSTTFSSRNLNEECLDVAINKFTHEATKDSVTPVEFMSTDDGIIPSYGESHSFTYKNAVVHAVVLRQDKSTYKDGWKVSSKSVDVLLECSKEIFRIYSELYAVYYKDESDKKQKIFRWSSASSVLEYSGPLQEDRRNSVFLKEGQMDELHNALDQFKESKDRYLELGVPYRMGILLYGPPGTGKTSTIKSIAGYTNRDIYYISLGSLNNDDDLYSAVEKGSQRIIVFEDIDIISTSHQDSEATAGQGGVSRQGLLNVLDGLNSPHDAIFIVTTNRRDLLDSALTRAGRIDFDMEIGYLDQYQLDSMLSFVHVGGERVILPEGVDITGSEIIGLVKPHMRDTSKAFPEILEYIEKKKKESHANS